MANGFCPALLTHLADYAGPNYPGNKVTMPGLTQYLYNQPNRPQVGANGHRQSVNVKYMVRGVESQVSTSAGCTVDAVPVYKETTVPISLFVQTGVWFGDDTIRQYCEDMSNTVAVGQPATQMMNAVVDGVFHRMNALYAKMESLLMAKAALNLGKHAATGTTSAVTVNIKQDGTVNDLGTGLTKLLNDADANEFCGDPSFVYGKGSLMAAYDLQMRRNAIGMADGGVNQAALAGYTGYSSAAVTAGLGNAQNMLSIPEGSIHLVENLRNVGSFAGTRGTSTFGTLVDPRNQCWGNLPIQWDFQAKYIDCAEDVSSAIGNGYINSSSITSDRGTLIIISKHFDLFVTPNDAFDGPDRIQGGGRPLLYTISNS